MKKPNTLKNINLQKLRDWLPTVGAHMVPIYKPMFFEQMGFPPSLVRQYVEKFVPIRTENDADVEPTDGVSGGLFLRAVAEVIGADTSEGDRKLSLSNAIEEWRKACIERLDEIHGEDSR